MGVDAHMEGPSNRIRELREERGWSLEQLAERCNTTNQQISRLERGQRELTLRWMQRVASALGVSVVQVLPPEMTQQPFDAEEETGFHWADMDSIYVTPWPVPVSRQKAGYSPHGCAWFGLEFLARMNIDPVLCKVVEIRDSTMQVSLPNGSVALMDGGRTALVDQGLYAIEYDGDLMIRCANQRRAGWLFKAEVDDWPPVSHEDVIVHGAVVWTARMVRQKIALNS